MTRHRICYYTTEFTSYSPSANARQKPLGLASHFDLTLVQPLGEPLPPELARLPVQIEELFPPGTPRWLVRLTTPFRWLRFLRRQKLQGQVDAVAVAFNVESLLLGWMAKALLRLPLVLFCWDPPGIFWRDKFSLSAKLRVGLMDAVFRRVAKHCDLLVLNIEKGLLNEIGVRIPENKVLALPNGVEVGRISACAEGINPDPWVLGLQSAVRREKNFERLKVMFTSLLRSDPRVRVVWVGDCPHNLKEEMAQALLSEGIPPGRVTFTGWLPQEEALRILAGAGVLLHYYPNTPSLRWNCSLKVVEYMALGRCIAAADLPGVRMYQDPEEPALNLLPPDDPKTSVLCLIGLLGNSSLQSRFGQRAAQQAIRHDWARINQTIAERIKSVLSPLQT